ncbi:hypothetical protein WJX72_010110 [[Myrmecia] bisecta]|uniref:Kinesin motor domain-containing protein n=1 Tax=[Myrmecia] bisecta TaxID=41462 RepID=A0AAW1P7Z3_9CHLO
MSRHAQPGVNVQVILRCRPANAEEVATRAPQVVTVAEAAKEVTLYQNVGGKQLGRSFHFDKAFGPESGQEKLYSQAIAPIVEEVLEGFNCTIFAYGQTGTGKTYTMEGGDRNSTDGSNLSEVAGVIPRAISQIFNHLDGINSEYTVKCSFLELYNEETTDLLAVGEASKAAFQKLRMLEDKSGVVVQGLEEIIVKNSTDIYTLLDRGSAKRKTAETLLNKQSSRSHSVFCITVHMREIAPDGEEVIKIGKLYLVDLAGSENVGRSGAVDMRAKEAGVINKSLLTLGRVITALVEQSGHIPYRDSKLTRLLRDSLGGRTKTCIIATIAPTVQCQEETLSTLDYAHRAKNIRNRPEVNQRVSKAAHIKELNAEIDRLKAELFATREKNGVYVPLDQHSQREQDEQQMRQRLDMLEVELEAFKETAKQEAQQLTAELGSTQEELKSTYSALRKARLGMEERDFLIATHERSENALASHAVNLSSELGAASDDIKSLFDRLASTNEREAGNAGVVAELRCTAESRLQAMEEAVSAAVEEQKQRFGDVQRLLADFLRQKEADMAALQANIFTLQGQLASVAQVATSSTDAAAAAATGGLSHIGSIHSDFTSAAQQAASEASTALQTAYAALADSLTAQKAHLGEYAAQQRAGTAAMLASTQRAVATAQACLRDSGAAAEACRESAQEALTTQGSALSDFERSFTHSMTKGQAELMQQIGGMLAAFAERKNSEVASAISGIQDRLKEDTQTVTSRFVQLTAVANGSFDSLQAEEAAATAAAAEASQKLQQQEELLESSLRSCTSQGQQLHAHVEEVAAVATERLESHAAAVASAVRQASSATEVAASAAKQECTTAVGAAEAGHKSLVEGVVASHTQDRAAVSQVAEAASKGDWEMQGFGKKHRSEITELTFQITDYTSNKFAQDPHAGMLPEAREIEVPAQGWVEDMRTPPPDVILAEFYRQKGIPVDCPADSTATPKPTLNPHPIQDDSPNSCADQVLSQKDMNTIHITADASSAAGAISKIPAAVSKLPRPSSSHADELAGGTPASLQGSPSRIRGRFLQR